jgi:hypothetical protein
LVAGVGVVVALRVLEELVGGGDDVLDLRAVLGFQQREGVDEHRLVGNELGGLLQLGQGGTGLDAGLEHGTAFQLARGGQRGQLVVRQLRAPRGIEIRHDAKTPSWSTCWQLMSLRATRQPDVSMFPSICRHDAGEMFATATRDDPHVAKIAFLEH